MSVMVYNMNDYEPDISGVGREARFGRKNMFPSHYYGDNVRKLFVAGAIIMLIALPFFEELISVPNFYYILGMIILGLIAGFTNPAQRWVVLLNLAISVFAIYFFENEAVSSFKNCGTGKWTWYFFTNQILAIIFLAALYYAAKTERGKWAKHKVING